MKKKLCLLLSFLLITALSTASFAGANSTPKINPGHTGLEGVDNFLKQADTISQTKDAVTYSYSGELNCTITEQIQNDGTVEFTVIEKGKKDIVKINKKTNKVYVNDELVKCTYGNPITSTETPIAKSEIAPIAKSGAAKVRYHNSTKPAYGKTSSYTYPAGSKNVSDIMFQQSIGALTAGAVLLVVSAICPWVGGLASIATMLKGAYDAKKTKHLSCKDKIFRHKSHKSGWYRGNYCEKHTTTWYPQKNYAGDKKVTNTFRNGVVI